MRFRLLPLLVLLASPAAFAQQDLPVTYNHVEYKQYGNTYQWQPVTKTGPGNGVVFRGDTTISNAEPKISTTARLPHDTRLDSAVPAAQKAKVTSAFTKANYGKALTLAGKIAWPIGVIMAAGDIYSYLRDLGLEEIQNTPNGLVAKKPIPGEVDGDYIYYSDAYGSSNSLLRNHTSIQSLCNAFFSNERSNYSDFQVISSGPSSCWAKGYRSPAGWMNLVAQISKTPKACPGGHFDSGSVWRCPTTSMRELNQQDIADEIARDSGWGNQQAKALKEAMNVPGFTIETEPPTVTGPSTTPGTTTTSTTSTQVAPGTTTPVAPGTPGAEPATQTTTTTTTTNNTYNNNTVTTNTTTTTTTNITNNVTNVTNTTNNTTESSDKPPDVPQPDLCEKYPNSAICQPAKEEKEDPPPTDTPLGDIPKLYERKYPDGIVGIWNDKSQSLKDSSVAKLIGQLMPSGVGDTGCPQWQLPLDIGVANYGTYTVGIPCDYWGYIRIVMIVASLFLARALIFGG